MRQVHRLIGWIIEFLINEGEVMNVKDADAKLDIINRLAREIESDAELRGIDSRYWILAKWIETDVNACEAE